MKKIVIVSDVLVSKQVNGVLTWLINTKKELQKSGFTVSILDASSFEHIFSLPGYPEIQLVVSRKKRVEELLKEMDPDYIHLATEGTLGYLARMVCVKNGWSFTTSYHTRFPEYFFTRTKMMWLQKLAYEYLRWFHNGGASAVVTTDTLQKELIEKNFTHVSVVPLGVDTELFKRNNTASLPEGLQKPVFVYWGRVAVEKNIDAFLDCELPGSKLVIGDGPARKILEEKFKNQAMFVGYKKGQDLVDLLSISDVAVFPSKTDTFGLTIIEGLACGLPVAGYNVQGPKNVIVNGKNGFLGDDLATSAFNCLSLKREDCVASTQKYSWTIATVKFIEILVSKNK